MRLRDNPDLWRRRAEQAREAAKRMSQPKFWQTMERIASVYDELTDEAELRKAKRGEPKTFTTNSDTPHAAETTRRG